MSLFTKKGEDVTKKAHAATNLVQEAEQERDAFHAELREQIRAKSAERNRVKNAPGPPEELIGGFSAYVDRLAAQWVETNHVLLLSFGAPGRAVPPPAPHDQITWAALCGMNGPALKARYAEWAKTVEYEAGPPAAERPALLAQLERELAELEAAEFEFVEANGLKHRPEVAQRLATERRQAELATDREKAARELEAQLDAARGVTGHRGPVHSTYLAPKP